jgi:L-erythro-3,5-diaminohexanoate dehydrogenase
VIPTAAALGADRVIAPRGALPQAAERLDSAGPVRPQELEIDVEALYLDSTSFAQLSATAEGDGVAIARSIEEIVAARGKLHNPVTGSGGVLVGTIAEVGPLYPHPPRAGQRIVTLASLTLTPLRLAAVGPAAPPSAQVPASGRAYLPATAPWAPVPDDLPLATVLAALDVSGAPSHTCALAAPGDTVIVLGAGHAGLLSLAAARDAVGRDGTVVAVDAAAPALERAEALGVCDAVLRADLQQPLDALDALRDAGLPRADLCVVVVNAPRCELASVLLTADDGTLLLFSMATSFTAAALGAEGVSANVRMIVGSGFSRDRGAYALELVRRHPALAAALEPRLAA